MNNITVTIEGSTYNLSKQDNPTLYENVLKHHKLMNTKSINIRVVTIDGIVHTFEVIPHKPLLNQLSKFPKEKFRILYDGFSLKPFDTVISLNMENGDVMDAIVRT